MNTFIANISNRALLNVPLLTKPKDGFQVKNWMAFIQPDVANRKFHLERSFVPKASRTNQGFYIVTSEYQIGRAVEFGSNISPEESSAQPLRHKWYGVITDIQPEYIEFTECGSAEEAMNWERENVAQTLESKINQKRDEHERLTAQYLTLGKQLEIVQKELDLLIMEEQGSVPQVETGYSAVDELFASFK